MAAKYDRFPEIVKKYEKLQTVTKLRDLIRRLWKIEVAFADQDGFVVDHARGKISPSQNQFCHRCLFDKNGLKKCDRTVVEITNRMKSGKYPAGGIFDNCHVGFKYVAVPVVVEDEFIGTVFGGGFLREEPDEEKQKEILEKSEPFHGTVIADLDAAIEEIPRLSDKDLQIFLQIIHFGIDEIERVHTELADQRVRVQELNAALANSYYGFHSIVGKSTAMEALYTLLDKLQESESTILIQGENGTGKELVAKAIHYNSPRRDRRFISQNCSAFNENLLDSELFGHMKGSFTGAMKDKKGLFETVDGGTFFMDEVGDMSSALQVKLLRMLQEGTFIPVGGTEPRKVDVRIIAATNRDLKQMVNEGAFREDLYYRMNVINLLVPPLRDRREDIPILVEHFLEKYSRRSGGEVKRISALALDALMAYNWPGNVRQLENEIQRSIVMVGDSQVIDKEILTPTVVSAVAETRQVKVTGRLKEAMEQVERQILLEGLRRHSWNKSRLSRELGISRATLIWKVEKYSLAPEAHT